jgi:hypothetical protein
VQSELRQARGKSPDEASPDHDPSNGEPAIAGAMVPMLDWPTDLFNTFTNSRQEP